MDAAAAVCGACGYRPKTSHATTAESPQAAQVAQVESVAPSPAPTAGAQKDVPLLVDVFQYMGSLNWGEFFADVVKTFGELMEQSSPYRLTMIISVMLVPLILFIEFVLAIGWLTGHRFPDPPPQVDAAATTAQSAPAATDTDADQDANKDAKQAAAANQLLCNGLSEFIDATQQAKRAGISISDAYAAVDRLTPHKASSNTSTHARTVSIASFVWNEIIWHIYAAKTAAVEYDFSHQTTDACTKMQDTGEVVMTYPVDKTSFDSSMPTEQVATTTAASATIGQQPVPAMLNADFTPTIGEASQVLAIKTNLPDGMVIQRLTMSPQKSDTPCYNCAPLYTTTNATVTRGEIVVVPRFGRQQTPMQPGSYALDLSFTAANQPPQIQAIIGKHGELLTGLYVNYVNAAKKNFGINIDYKTLIAIDDPADQAAATDQTDQPDDQDDDAGNDNNAGSGVPTTVTMNHRTVTTTRTNIRVINRIVINRSAPGTTYATRSNTAMGTTSGISSGTATTTKSSSTATATGNTGSGSSNASNKSMTRTSSSPSSYSSPSSSSSSTRSSGAGSSSSSGSSSSKSSGSSQSTTRTYSSSSTSSSGSRSSSCSKSSCR